MSLKGKVALITGADGGLGRAIAERLATEGAAVAVHYHTHRERALQVADRIIANGGRAQVFQADVSQPDDVDRFARAVATGLGQIDILVNNAGIQHCKPFLDLTLDDWDTALDVDLRGAFLLSQAVARGMVERRAGGRIINITSVHETVPWAGYTPYCVAKSAEGMLTRNLALELAPYQITVNAIAPGAMAGGTNEPLLADPQAVATLEADVPLKRLGQPGELAALVAFLAGDEAGYVTGATIYMDGGLSIQVLDQPDPNRCATPAAIPGSPQVAH